jgi:hypothetical protein
VILRRIRRGKWQLYAVCNARGDCDLLKFLRFSPGDAIAQDKTRMLGLFRRVAESPTGPPKNDEVSHQLNKENDIWEFIVGRVRVVWFYESGRVLILTHGFMKATQKTPPAQIYRAIKARKDYLRDKKTPGSIKYLEDTDGDDV